MNKDNLTVYHWYIAVTLASFLFISFLLQQPDLSLSSLEFANDRTVGGIILDFDPLTAKVRLLTIDEMNYGKVASSTYELELFVTADSELIDQNFVVNEGVISSLTEKVTTKNIELYKGDYVYIKYKNRAHGFEIAYIRRGIPFPKFGVFTPQFLELQAQVLSEPVSPAQ